MTVSKLAAELTPALAAVANERIVLQWLDETTQYPGQPILSSIAEFGYITPAEARDALARLADSGDIVVDGPCLKSRIKVRRG